MRVFPNAKINLGLHVLRKRPDGYHDLETCMLPIGWKEELEVEPASAFAFSAEGLAISGAPEDNLCARAYQLMRQEYQIEPVHIRLHKTLPMGAGLGGGSADAAETLKALNQLYHLNLTTARLEELAARLGSDCAFFVANQPALATGRGEVLAPLPEQVKEQLARLYYIVLAPDFGVSTALAYGKVKPQADRPPLTELLQAPVAEWKDCIVNDFEAAIFPEHSSLAALKEQLYQAGAVYAAMSGSGSAMYGLFTTSPPTEAFAHISHQMGKLS